MSVRVCDFTIFVFLLVSLTLDNKEESIKGGFRSEYISKEYSKIQVKGNWGFDSERIEV